LEVLVLHCASRFSPPGGRGDVGALSKGTGVCLWEMRSVAVLPSARRHENGT